MRVCVYLHVHVYGCACVGVLCKYTYDTTGPSAALRHLFQASFNWAISSRHPCPRGITYASTFACTHSHTSAYIFVTLQMYMSATICIYICMTDAYMCQGTPHLQMVCTSLANEAHEAHTSHTRHTCSLVDKCNNCMYVHRQIHTCTYIYI